MSSEKTHFPQLVCVQTLDLVLTSATVNFDIFDWKSIFKRYFRLWNTLHFVILNSVHWRRRYSNFYYSRRFPKKRLGGVILLFIHLHWDYDTLNDNIIRLVTAIGVFIRTYCVGTVQIYAEIFNIWSNVIFCPDFQFAHASVITPFTYFSTRGKFQCAVYFISKENARLTQ